MSSPTSPDPNPTPSGSPLPGGPAIPPFLAPGPVPEIPSNAEERKWAGIMHFSGICCGFIVGLILWIVKKDTSPFLNDQGKEAVNYQISIFIASVVLGIGVGIIALVLGVIHLSLIGTLLTYLVWAAVFIGNLLMCITAGTKANSGVVYRYPAALRLIK
jgi:hypothetical protein